MFKGLGQWIKKIQAYDESRRKRIVFVWVGVLFVLICIIWIVVLTFGFSDFGARWISGTRTYTASGTETYDNSAVSSLSSSWETTRDRMGEAWSELMKTFESLPELETTPSSTTTSSITTITTTTTINHSLSTP